ncbi:MAG: hypothetical protein AB7O65_01420 [Candidatus Korobacteraceae bacterium]
MAEPAPMFQTPADESSGARWIALLVAALLVAAIVGAVVYFSNTPPPQGEQPLDRYAENLQVGDLKLSVAENFVGSSIHYVDGKIANVGGRTVDGIRVEVIFRDSLGQIVLRETQTLMLLKEQPGDLPTELVSLKNDPLEPNEVADFRLTFERLPADWNRGLPELRFVQVSLTSD